MFFKGRSEMDGFPLNGSGLLVLLRTFGLQVLQPDHWIYWFLTGWEDKEKAFDQSMHIFTIKELLTGRYSMTIEDFH
jgi:hypothetical protein